MTNYANNANQLYHPQRVFLLPKSNNPMRNQRRRRSRSALAPSLSASSFNVNALQLGYLVGQTADAKNAATASLMLI